MSFPQVDPLDWRTIQPHVDALLVAELTPATADAWLQQWSDLASVLYETQAQINRKVTENTADEEADRQFMLLVEQIIPQARIADQALRDRLLALQASWLHAGPDAVELLRRFRRRGGHLLRGKCADPQRIDEAGQPVRQDHRRPVHRLGRHDRDDPAGPPALAEQDRAEREKAWRLVMEAYLAQREKLNELYLQMLDMRRQVAKNAGLADFRDYKWLELARFDYTPADCVTFHDAIEHEVVPLAREIYAEHAGKLGLSTLRPWDVDVDPGGEPLDRSTTSASWRKACRIFNQVDPSWRRLRGNARRLPRPPLVGEQSAGRVLRGFSCHGEALHLHERCRRADDVSTMLHEGGHAFHFMESRRQPLVWNHNGPMEFCEVASMSMELLSAPYLTSDQAGSIARPTRPVLTPMISAASSSSSPTWPSWMRSSIGFTLRRP